MDYIGYINILLFITTVASVIIAFISIGLMIGNVNIIVYSALLKDSIVTKVFIALVIFVDKFYSYNIILINYITVLNSLLSSITIIGLLGSYFFS